MRTVSQTEGQPPPNAWDSQQDGHSLSSRDFWSQKQRGILRLLKWSVVRGTPINKGSWFPFASRSLEAPGRERPQPTPDHTGDLHDRCPILDINAEQWLFIASYQLRRRLLLHRESLPLMLSHLALIQQRCVDSCPGSLRSLLHDSSRQIDAYSSLNRFSSRSTNATISESPIATFNEH